MSMLTRGFHRLISHKQSSLKEEEGKKTNKHTLLLNLFNVSSQMEKNTKVQARTHFSY